MDRRRSVFIINSIIPFVNYSSVNQWQQCSIETNTLLRWYLFHLVVSTLGEPSIMMIPWGVSIFGLSSEGWLIFESSSPRRKKSHVFLVGQLKCGLSKPLKTLHYLRAKWLQEKLPVQSRGRCQSTQSWERCANGYMSVLVAGLTKFGLITTGAFLLPLPSHKMDKSEHVAHRYNRWTAGFRFAEKLP